MFVLTIIYLLILIIGLIFYLGLGYWIAMLARGYFNRNMGKGMFALIVAAWPFVIVLSMIYLVYATGGNKDTKT